MKLKYGRKKWASIFVAIVMAGWAAYQNSKDGSNQTNKTYGSVILTKHAKCRMECRFISKSEIDDVISNGKTNHYKSNKKAKPCPVFAKEKMTSDGQLARVVYADCLTKVKIITVIDLDTDHPCDCK